MPTRSDPTDRNDQDSHWFWATLILSSVSIIALVFAAWELVENQFFREVDYVALHYLYISRGIASSLILASWAAWYVLRQRLRSEEELRRSWERYRHLLEVSPAAMALYDASLRVSEWNATAERLYGFARSEVIGRPLPMIPPEKEAELRRFIEQIRVGEAVLAVETRRRHKQGASFEVELSLLPFREASGQVHFLEVTTDIRERVRLRETLLEVEKLTSMGKMAAGTAHHLNTPLAAILLRVQMMRDRADGGPWAQDLDLLEKDILFCQQFVRRLLEFSRRPAAQKQPEDMAHTVESVVSFFGPALLAKGARVQVDVGEGTGVQVLADRNLFEALFSILLSNALDAIGEGGTVAIRCRCPSEGRIEIEFSDDGCGIAPEARPRIFEPFFTTKAPGKGTGLGLAIARSIVVEHGGSIRLDSETARGTRATVELPVWRPQAVSQERRA